MGRNNKAQTYPRRPASAVPVAIGDKSQTRVPSLSLHTTPLPSPPHPPRQVAALSQLSCSTARGLGEGGYLASLGTRSRRHCTSSRWVLDSSSRPSMHALGQLVCFAPSNRVPATTNFTVPVLGRSLEGTGCSANLASRPYGSVDSRFGLDEGRGATGRLVWPVKVGHHHSTLSPDSGGGSQQCCSPCPAYPSPQLRPCVEQCITT